MISNGLTQSLPLKFFYAGPMFRYERPQKGRMRQLHQIGIEYLGRATGWRMPKSLPAARVFSLVWVFSTAVGCT